MFKNYYTTEMSGEGRLLAERFRSISKPMKYGRALRLICTALTIIMLFSAALASVVLARVMLAPSEITVFYDGKVADLRNEPFIDNSEFYFPLRETLNLCGVADENIIYSDGNITAVIHSAVTDSDYTAHITVGQPNIRFDGARDRVGHPDGAMTTTHPVLMYEDVTYVPLGMLIDIKQYAVEAEGGEILTGFRHARTKPVKLLRGLQIRKYNQDGSFDMLLSDWTIAESSDPADYYEEGERVFIGTGEQQQSLGYDLSEVNGYHFPSDPIKRILVDGDGKVIAVVPVENQRHEGIDGRSGLGETYSASTEGWLADIDTVDIVVPISSSEDVPEPDTAGMQVPISNHLDVIDMSGRRGRLSSKRIVTNEKSEYDSRMQSHCAIPVELITRMRDDK